MKLKDLIPPEKQNHGVCPRDGGHQQGDRQYSAG